MDGIVKEIKFLMYNTSDKNIQIEAVVKDDTLRLTQKSMANLFEIDQSGIARHIKNIFDSGELDKNSVYAIFAYTGTDGKTYDVQFYNLDAVISVGYRVNSVKATHFRIWATNILREYIQKGFVLDDNRLKQGEKVFSKDYFNELLERIRSIRASERVAYGNKLQIFLQNVVLTMTGVPLLPKNFMRLFKINFIMLSQGKLQQK